MERWSAWREVPLTVTEPEGDYRISLPNGMSARGKDKIRVRVVMWPSWPHYQHTPAVDAVRAKCYPSEKEVQLLPSSNRFMESTIATHTGYGPESSQGGRAAIVRDRTVLGSYSYPIEASSEVREEGVYFDTAVGFKVGAFGDGVAGVDWDFERGDEFVFQFDSGVPISWTGHSIWDLSVGWIIATPHPAGGVSFVRMMEPQWGPNRNKEFWYCDAPRAIFGLTGSPVPGEEGMEEGNYVPGHQPTAFIYENSPDVPPQPYGPVYMCEACREYAAEHGYDDVGFGGDDSANRFIKLKTNSPAIYATQYSRPAAVSGHAQEFYFNHHPLHNTRADLNWSGIIVDNEAVALNDDMSERGWGRDTELRGLHGGQLNHDAPNSQVFLDPWFSDARPTPTLLESDFMQPPQYQQSKTRLSRAYPVGDYDFPVETIFKWKTATGWLDPFSEPQPIDEPLNMRCFDLAYNSQYPCIYNLRVTADHFYIGSNSRTASTDSAYTKQPRNDQFAMFFKWTMMGATLGLAGTLTGIGIGASYLNQPWQFPDAKEKTGGGGTKEKPTRYLRKGWDFTPWQQIIQPPHNRNDHDFNTRLPNGDIMPWQEHHFNHVFGVVPSINAFVDYDGHIVLVWNHSKRWHPGPSVIMHKMGKETQMREVIPIESNEARVTPEEGRYSYAANPNRVIHIGDGSAPNIFFDPSTGSAWCLWNDWVRPEVGYLTYIKQFNIHDAMSPHGTLYNASGNVSFFAGEGEMTERQDTHQSPEDISDMFIPNVDPDNPQKLHQQHARHPQVKFHDKLPVAYLSYDREILYTHKNGVLEPANGNEEYNFTVSQVYLERALIDPWGKILAFSPDGDLQSMLNKQGAMRVSDTPIAIGRNPAVTFARDSVFIFYNRDDNQIHDKVYHGGGYQEYTATIPPSNDIELKIDGAPIEPDPMGQRPYVAAYVSTWPVAEDVYFRASDIAMLEQEANQFVEDKIGQGESLGSTEEWNTHIQENRQRLMEHISAEALEDETRVVMRDGALPSPNLLGEIISGLRKEAKQLSAQPSFSSNPQEVDIEDMENAYLGVYKAYPQVSHALLYALFGGIIQGWSDKELKYMAWTRSYIENDNDVRCPECGEFDIWWDNNTWGRLPGQDTTYPEREIATFNCNGCGKQWVEQCHGFPGANVDATYEEAKNRLWVVGGRWRENLSLGAADGELMFTWSVNNGGIWKAEKWLPTDQVNYRHIANKNPGPDNEDRKPYLWDSSDTFQHEETVETDFKLKETTMEDDYQKVPIPIDDGLEHIAVLPEHKVSVFTDQVGNICVAYLQLELYDAALAARKTDNPKGDHASSTCSPTIPRIAKTEDGGLSWTSDYFNEDEDVMLQPKRDWWELPKDLKDKTQQG